MATFIYTNEFQANGPWLVDREELLELDRRIGEVMNRLQNKAAAETLLAVQPDDRPQRAPAFRREVTLKLSGNHELKAASFADAEGHPELLQRTAIGFNLVAQTERSKIEIELERSDPFHEFRVSATPADDEGANELFTAVIGWAARVGPPFWLRHWNMFVAMFAPVVYFVVAGMLVRASATDSPNPYREQAVALLRTGINQNNQAKAIEVLLALESGGATQQVVTPKISTRMSVVLIAGALAALMLTIFPRTTVGIGRGERVVKRWRAWTRFVVVLVPTFVFANLIWPLVQALILG